MRLTIAMIAVLLASGVPSLQPANPGSWTCLPTCRSDDGRFLAVIGDDRLAIGTHDLLVAISTSADQAVLRLAIFDGDRNPWSAAATDAHWDVTRSGRPGPALTLAVLADADGRLATHPDTLLSASPVWSSSDPMKDNDWTVFEVANVPEARTPTGYRYALRITASDRADAGWNVFKVKVAGRVSLPPQTISFVAAMTPPAVNSIDARIIYPQFPSLASTTYDGTWEWSFEVPTEAESLVVWDADWDLGSADCSTADTDDGDSPPLPPFEPLGAAVQGRAIGLPARPAESASKCGLLGRSTGDPYEDTPNSNFSRAPFGKGAEGVAYVIQAPGGVRFVNNNPSGNSEWEQFKVVVTPTSVPRCLSDDALLRTRADCVSPSLPAGVYRLLADGVDLNNLSVLRFEFPVLGPSLIGRPGS